MVLQQREVALLGYGRIQARILPLALLMAIVAAVLHDTDLLGGGVLITLNLMAGGLGNYAVAFLLLLWRVHHPRPFGTPPSFASKLYSRVIVVATLFATTLLGVLSALGFYQRFHISLERNPLRTVLLLLFLELGFELFRRLLVGRLMKLRALAVIRRVGSDT